MKTIITILLLSFTMALSAQIKPSIIIGDVNVKVTDYLTGENIRKYNLSEVIIIETKRRRIEKIVSYREIGVMGDTLDNISYNIIDISFDDSFYYLDLESSGSRAIIKISKTETKKGIVHILIGDKLYNISGVVIRSNL